MSEAMIEARNVVKAFDGFRALDGLTMTVPRGSIYGLVGPNGAGKSTLLRHVTGIYRQDSGSVLLEGNPIYRKSGGQGPDCLHPRRAVLLPLRLHTGHDALFPGLLSPL